MNKFNCPHCGEVLEIMPSSEPKKAVVEEKKTEDKHVYKVGDKVKVIANTCNHDRKIGDIITLSKADASCVKMANRPAWDMKESVFYISERDIEPYTEPKEPIARLYCVEDWIGINDAVWLKRGNTYGFDSSRRFVYEDGSKTVDTFTDTADVRLSALSAFLIPLVQRPAKIGEWVYFVQDMGGALHKNTIHKCDGYGHFSGYMCSLQKGRNGKDIYLVLDGYTAEDDLSNYEWVDGHKGFDADLNCRNYQYEIGKEYDLGTEESMCNKGFHFCKTLEETHKYYSGNDVNRFCKVQGLVKKGTAYDGKYCARKIKIVEEVKQTYFNGKVVCTASRGYENAWKTGTVYQFKDGYVTDDTGARHGKYTDFAGFKNAASPEFLEITGEQS